jgi:prolyl oligopeptidase
VFVGTDFGEGSLTSSGYPRTVRIWKRGVPLEDARQLAEGDTSDVSIGGFTVWRPEGPTRFIRRTPEFFRSQVWWLDDDFAPHRIPLPEDAQDSGLIDGRMLVRLRSEWAVGDETFAAGSLVSVRLAESVRTGEPSDVELVFEPSDRASLRGVSTTRDAALIGVLEEVRGSLLRAAPAEDGWRLERVELPADGTVGVVSADDHSDVALASFQSFLVPDRLYLLRDGRAPRAIKALPDRFDASGFVTEQRFATSADGERIPFFVVRTKDLAMDGSAPTLLTGYGGFEVSRTPSYASPGTIEWLEEGGVFALANIRGGGEFGPGWHQAALRGNRQRAYDDFIAVAEELVASGITSPGRLGISGGSNGGLLVAAVAMQRPELFGAVVCSVPLLDMLRYHRLLAGASWMAEYGNPDDPEIRAVIEAYSPYQNVRADVDYPEIFFWTNTRDDRVHPGHPRKMVARMMEQGHPVLYFENTEGGHSAGANLRQAARTTALTTVYLLQKLADG